MPIGLENLACLISMPQSEAVSLKPQPQTAYRGQSLNGAVIIMNYDNPDSATQD